MRSTRRSTTRMATATTTRTDGTGLIDIDPWLEPFAPQLRQRYQHYQHTLNRIGGMQALLGPMSTGHHYFGFNRGTLYGKPGVWYREWAPEALQLRVIGDFNGWDRMASPMVRDNYGVWSLFFPDDQFADRLTHASKVKVHVIPEKGQAMDRIPAYIRRVVQDPKTAAFSGQFWMPPTPHQWKHEPPVKMLRAIHDGSKAPRIYEAHVGMAQEEGKV